MPLEDCKTERSGHSSRLPFEAASQQIHADKRVSVNFGGVSENVSKRTSSHPACDPAPSTNEDVVCHPSVDICSVLVRVLVREDLAPSLRKSMVSHVPMGGSHE